MKIGDQRVHAAKTVTGVDEDTGVAAPGPGKAGSVGDGFQRPHRRGADRDDPPATGLGRPDPVARFGVDLDPFGVHDVFRDALDPRWLKGAGPDVQSDEGSLHAQSGDPVEQGDLEEAMNAASQIGDDTLQQNAGGAVRPESFTHGSSAQRMRWFQRGFQSGQVSQCDTFQARSL